MKRILHLLFIQVILLFSVQAVAQLNPADPVVTYNSGNPPPTPDFNKITKWVRTVRMGWNTDLYKAYIFRNMAFRLKFPKTYQHGVSDGKKYPVLVFFHGVGEAGTIYDNEFQLLHGGELMKNAVENGTYDGFLLYAQSQDGTWGNPLFDNIKVLLDSMALSVKADLNRVCVNGLSHGGLGTWDWTFRYPWMTAGSLPMCAASTIYTGQSYVDKVKFMPVWMFQGGLDNNPAPYTAGLVRDAIRNAGGTLTYSFYPNEAHSVWYSAWAEPDFFSYLKRANRLLPQALFQKTALCPGESTTIGISPGFLAYQWRKDGVDIAGTGNSIVVNSTGSYSVRAQTAEGWTEWSPTPLVITASPSTTPPIISPAVLATNVFPAPNGATNVALQVPAGMETYEWIKTGTTTVLSTTNTLTASAVGGYVVRAKAANLCVSAYSDTFRIVNANGANGPDPISGLIVSAFTKTSLTLNWAQNVSAPFNEKYFEIYRSATAGGPYTLVAKNAADVLTYTDNNLTPGTNYFYIVRPVNDNAAAAVSVEVKGTTTGDATPPTIPTSLTLLSTGNTFVYLQWNAATDDAGITGYEIYANGVLQTTVSGTTTKTQLTGLNEGTFYNIYVKAKDASGKLSGASNQVTTKTLKANLTYKYYQGTWSTLPNFANLTANKTGKTVIPDLTPVPSNRTTNFGFLWTGYIHIPVDGNYTFATGSDDGSKLYFNRTYSHTATATVNNDGLHGESIVSGTVNNLTAGVYPIAITFFQQGGGSAMKVYWTNTTLGVTQQLIPGGYFMDTVSTSGGTAAPAAPSALTATANGWSKINLAWTDNSSNETGFEVYRSATSGGTYQIVGTVAANIKVYTDTALNQTTAYYYRVRAIGTYGESAMSGTATATTGAKPLPPAAPTAFLATALSTTVVKLQWTDASNNESNFEIYRSLNDQNNYSLLKTTAANVVTVNDSTLAANTIAWYRVRSIGEGGASAYATADSAKTLSNPPVISNIPSQSIRYGTTTNIAIQASDPDSDPITYSLLNAPAFITVVADPGNVHLAAAPLAADMGVYNNIGVIAKDSHNASDTTYFNLTVNDNFAPVITAIGAVTANEGKDTTIAVTATDANAADHFTWSVLQKPAFVTVTGSGDTLRLLVSAGYADAGTYTVEVKVTDSQGAIDTKSFTLTVNDKPTPNYNLFINIKGNNTAPAPWNNVTGLTTVNLVNDRGETTTAGLTFDTYWWATHNQGAVTGNNSGVYPDVVLGEYLYFGSLPGVFSSPSSINGKLTGLETNRAYTVKFMAGSQWGAPQPDNGTTNFTINGITKPLYTHNNTSNLAIFANLTPNAAGEIAFNLAVPAGGQVGFLSAIEVNAGGAGEPPVNQAPVMTAITNKSVQEGAISNVTVSAVDPEGDNITYSVVDAPAFVTITGTQLRFAPLAGNAGSYNNIGVIAKDSHNNADTTRFNLTVTPAGAATGYKIFINIKGNNTAPTPWNNVTGLTTGSLVNDNGETTTAGLTFDTYWWATHNQGAVTGNNSGVYPDVVLGEYLYFGSLPGVFSSPSSINGKLTGLETNRAYTVKFMAGSQWGAPQPDNGTTNFTINGITKPLYTHNNTSNLAIFANLTPNAAGEIAFNLAVPAGGQVGFLSAIEVNAGGAGEPPVNQAPVMTAITNKSVQEGAISNVTVSAVDPEGDNITYSVVDAPAFVTITGTQLRFAPLAGNAGSYNNIGVIAKDSHNNADTTRFNLTVTPAGAATGYKIFINIKGSNTAPAPWNNVTGLTTGSLVNDNGETTTAGLTFDTWWWATHNQGAVTGNNSGVYPDAVLAEYLYFGSLPGVFSSPSSINGKITGLETNRAYTVKFMAGSQWGAPQPDNGTTNFTIGGVTKPLYTHNNTSNLAVFANLTPNAAGEIAFNLAVPAGGQVGFLSAIEINAGAEGGVPPVNHAPELAAVANQSVAVGSTTNVNLSATDADGDVLSYSLVNAPAFVTIVGTQLRFTPPVGSAGTYNNIGAIVTDPQNAADTVRFNLEVTPPGANPGYKFLINIKSVTSAPAPWNNATSQTTNNLVNDRGETTSARLVFDTWWWATYTEGAVTGNNSGVYPDAVMSEFLYFGNLPGVFNGPSTINAKLAGLDPTRTYSLKFFGSSKWWAPQPDNGSTEYTVGTVTKTLYVHNNTANVVSFENLTPNAAGEIVFTLSVPSGGQVGYLNAIEVDVAAQGGGGGGQLAFARDADKNNNATAQATELTLAAYPNPVQDELSVDVELRKEAHVQFEFFDITGRISHREARSNVPAGKSTFRLHTANYLHVKGFYLLKVSASTGESKVIKLLKR
ncbi:hypothetical protein EGT74_15035 [Chitinophaga lutea]|uniref:T9SS C-terminal target domain-containing protein n=1 Tax=Chitinophaga lutea TaxID=2488634 RepID=A0A3N4Q9G5_9BACT|nr:fibronectin type III domain-containing protein [Chitinophaga lutea]RPE08364.1 hypothetical protein EGT74_15035 [Chitinophaga lutea]